MMRISFRQKDIADICNGAIVITMVAKPAPLMRAQWLSFYGTGDAGHL